MIITEEDVMKYCQSRNLMLVTKESLEYMHRPIVIENAPTVESIPVEWIIELSNRLKDDEDDFEKAMFLLKLVDLWEKENGK